MGTKKSLAGYKDVEEIFIQAAAAGGGRYELDTPGQAMHWRQRAYAFRKLYRQRFPEDERFEQFTLRCEGNAVVIETVRPKGTFQPVEGGTPIDIERPAVSRADDDLLNAAEELKKLNDIL